MLDCPWNINIVDYWLINFDHDFLSDDKWVLDIHLLDNGVLNPLDDRSGDDLWYNDNFLVNDRDLDYLLNNLFDLLDYCHDMGNFLLDLFDSLLNDDVVSEHFDFLNLLLKCSHLHNLLNNLRNLDNLLFFLNNGDWSLNYSFNDLVFNLNIWNHLFLYSVFDLLHYLLDNFLNFDDLRNLDLNFDDLLNECWNLHNFLNNPLYFNNFLYFYPHLFDFRNEVVCLLLNLHDSLNFHNLFNNNLNFDYLWDLSCDFYNLISHDRHLDHFLNDSLNGNNLLYNVVHNSGNFERHVYNLLHLFDFFYFNNLLHNLLD